MPKAPADIAWPVDFDRRAGSGLDRTVCLGGGGVFFIAWQVGFLQHLEQSGIDLSSAERVVGTSAGSIVASALTAGRIGWLHAQLATVGRFPAIVQALAPAADLQPSQRRALDLFRDAKDAEPATVQAIGRAAMAAITPEPARMRRNVQVVVPARWPTDALHITCVDAYTAERCVVSRASGVRPARAAAASSAVPGLFPPQPIGDRCCMDGGVSGSGTHLDLLAGAKRAFVLSLVKGPEVTDATMTVRPGDIEAEVAALKASGTDVFLRAPAAVDETELMSSDVVLRALAAGAAQAADDLDAMREFWS